MNLFQTTAEQKIRVYEIASNMEKSGLAKTFIVSTVEIASESEAIYDLMELWDSEEIDTERDEILADLQEAIDEEYEQLPHVVERRKINYKSLDDVYDS